MERSSSPRVFTLAAVALGISTACFMDCLALLTSPRHDVVYHIVGPASAIFIPALVNILFLFGVCFCGLLVARRSARAWRILWSGIVSFLPWIIVKNICTTLGKPLPHHVSITFFALGGLAFSIFAISRASAVTRIFEFVQSFAETVLSFIAIAGAVAFVQTAWFGVQARHLNDSALPSAHVQTAERPTHGRVIWIVLDELGYRQVYEHRPHDLALPAFDQLRTESTVFSNVRPAGMYTERVLPALMTGQAVTQVRASADGLQLFMHNGHGWRSFNQQRTVFADADGLGYRTAVVGWYIPYCRILPAVLSSCFWTGPSELQDMFPTHRIGPNLVHPLLRLVRKISPFFRPTRLSASELALGSLHILQFKKLDRASDKALADPRNDFLLLHMPVPHPSGIWDRHLDQFAVDRSSYVDNLALADAYLGHVRQVLEANGQWDSATILVMGDHAWRTRQIWSSTQAWNEEDQQASDGDRFDDRPGYILKLPGQHMPAEITAAFPALRTRALLDQLLADRFTDPDQLKRWVNEQREP
jgi:hypothetical protein